MAIKVFLADDHAVIRDGLRLLLEGEKDISVVGEAKNGRETVRHVKQICPDVVVMDIAMPEMNGIDATHRIREVCPSTKVIILSMHASNEHVYQALRAGASGYLMKESAGSEVVHAVRAVYSGRRYLSREITETVIDNYMVSREIPPTQSPLVRLSSREREVLQLVVEGKSSTEIAGILSLSVKTIETYRSRIMQKLNIGNIPGLVKFAIKHGLTTLK